MNVREYQAYEELDDGRRIKIRAIRPEDRDDLASGFKKLSARSVYQRFFAAKKRLATSEIENLIRPDFIHHVAIGAEIQADRRYLPAGVARYYVDENDSEAAEVAIIVVDEYQNIGIGSILLCHLGEIAKKMGLKRFVALILPDNRQMIEFLKNSDFPCCLEMSGGVSHVTITL